MKIIVTGGAGFIASHVVDAYVRAGHTVAVIDNLRNGFRKNLNPKAKFYKTDIEDLAAVEKIFKKERPEVVNHHAAIAEVVRSVRDPIPTLQTNVLGTANLLLAFGKFGRGAHKKFIFSSTGGAMYGRPKKVLSNEATPPAPLSPYGLSKLLAEETIRFYARMYDFPYFIFRYANVYGPRQNSKGEAGVVAIFIGLMQNGAQPTIFGDGSKTRDYVYVKDVARANALALKKGRNVTINIGLGREVSDRTVYNAIAKAMKSPKKPRYAPFRKGEVLRIAIDARQARKVLGWKPTTTFEQGVRETVESFS